MAAPVAKTCMENYVTGFNDSSAKDLAKCLLDGSVTLTDLIENLGVYLTNPEVSTRARATRCISDTIENLPPDFLSETQVSMLSIYLCEKLKDHHSIHSCALSGLLSLSKSLHVNGGVIDCICRSIFKEIHVQSMPQGDRRVVYNILLGFLTSHLQEVQKLGTDFVYGFIQAMDGEKDPRNLVLAFHSANIIINHLPLGVFVEEMFEVVSCYFPIDFTPSANEPSGIKKEDLIKALRGCMSATPKFAQYCLPLLMEKLTSDLKSAKIDALDTLALCAEAYGAENLQGMQSSFFNCIRKEVFLSGDSTLEEAGLSALKSLVKALSTGVSKSDKKGSLDGYVEEILSECKNHLLQPELMLMLSSGRLLQSVALASEPACRLVVKETVPLLLESYNTQSQPTPRHNVLVVLNGFMKATAVINQDSSHPVLPEYKDHLLTVYSQSLADSVPSIQVLAVEGFHILLSLHSNCLLATERAFIAAKLVAVVTEAEVDPSVRTSCTAALEYALSVYPEDVQSVILPNILNKLQHVPMEEDQNKGYVHKAQLLNILSNITVGKKTVSVVMEKLCAMISQGGDLEKLQGLTLCMANIALKVSPDTECQQLLCDTGVKCVIDLMRNHGSSSEWKVKLTCDQVLANMAAFLRHVAIHCSKDLFALVQSDFLKIFLPISSNHGEGPIIFSPLQSPRDAGFTSLLTPVLCSRPQEEPMPAVADVLTHLTDLVQHSLESATHTHVCKCLAGLINKLPQDTSLDTLLASLEARLASQISMETKDASASATQAVLTWSWITKALVLRGHPSAKVWVDKLLALLSSPDLGKIAAQGVEIVLTECVDVMNKDMRANVKILYRQRFFLENLDKIVTGFNQAGDANQTNFLLTLSHCIQGLNKQVLISQLSEVYPLLIKSLLSDNIELQLATMVTLGDLIEAAPDIVDKHVDSLIPQLLSLATYKSSMKVRMAAVRCLGQLTSLPLHVALPYRAKVVRDLLPVLDDRKRLVRAEAVEARQRWILLDSPTK